jgi:hypothetical protein
LGRIEEKFSAVYAKKKSPHDMAVFTRHDSEGRLHCEVMAYFSPAAAEVARLFRAVPCNKPCIDGLSLLAGPESSWAALFNKQTE